MAEKPNFSTPAGFDRFCQEVARMREQPAATSKESVDVKALVKALSARNLKYQMAQEAQAKRRRMYQPKGR